MSHGCSSRLAVALGAVWLLGCATLSVEEERDLGKQVEAEARRELRLLHDDVVVGYVAALGREIVAAAGPQPFEYGFEVVVDENVNAFAMPAGAVFVHTGLIAKARNVSELAGVMAHEVGHVARRHIARNYSRQRWTGLGHRALVIGSGILGGGQAAGAANLLGGLAAVSYLNTFGREAERESDAFAVEVLPRAGYDPHGLVSFFAVLKEQGGSNIPEFLSSHPATDERIANTRALIEQARVPAGLRVHDGGRLEIIQRRIELLTGGGGEVREWDRRR